MIDLIISIRWTGKRSSVTMVDVSVLPTLSVRVRARPLGRLDTNDCSDLVTREGITAELNALPFLGELTCSTAAVVAGSTEEVVFTYTVGRSGIADSGWLKLCFRYYSDWDLQTTDPDGRDFASARLVSRSLVGGASQQSAATAQRLTTRYDVKGGERPFQKALLIDVKDGYLRPGDVLEIRLGDRRSGGPGTRVQTFVEDEFEFHLFVDALGTSRMARAGVSRLAVVPGPPERVIVHGPRLVRADAPTADLRVHLQDRWGNASRDVTASVRAHADGRGIASASFPVAGWAALTLPVPSRQNDMLSRPHRRLPFAACAVRRSACAFQRHGRHPGHRVELGLRARYRCARRDRLHRQRLSDHR